MPPHLKQSKHRAHLESGPNKQIVRHLEKEIELIDLRAPDGLQYLTNTNADRSKLTCNHCKKPGHYSNQSRLFKKQKYQAENTQKKTGNENSGASNSTPNNNNNNNNNKKKQ